jgi:hypothetical protein
MSKFLETGGNIFNQTKQKPALVENKNLRRNFIEKNTHSNETKNE